MKKIEKLNIIFEKRIKPTRRQLEVLHDKINECVRALNFMHGHLEPWDILGSARKARQDSLDDLFKRIKYEIRENLPINSMISVEELKNKQRDMEKILDNYRARIKEAQKVLDEAGIPKLGSYGPGTPRRLLSLAERIKALIDKAINTCYELGVDCGTGPDRSVVQPCFLDIKEPDWMDDPALFLIDEQEEKKLLKKHSVDKSIKGDKVLFENFMYNEKSSFNIVGVGIPMISDDPEKDLKDFFSKTALLYYGLWQKKDTFKERMSGKLFSKIKLIMHGKVFMGLKDKAEKKPVWYFENVQLSFEEMHDFDKYRDNNIFHFEWLNLAVLENGRYQVEKWRLPLTELKIGQDLHNEFLKFTMTSPCQYISGQVGDMKFCGAKITFVLAENETYYMKRNEILFLSACDDIYARGVKK